MTIITDGYIEKRIRECSNRNTGWKPSDMTPSNIAPDNEEALIEFLKTSKRFCLSTYGGRFRNFKAVCERYQ